MSSLSQECPTQNPMNLSIPLFQYEEGQPIKPVIQTKTSYAYEGSPLFP